MNREIKFRAWDGERMLFSNSASVTISFDHIGWIAGAKNEFGEKYILTKQDQGSLMQYTGLKDKEGKEIYDGDIVGGFPHGTVTVRWNNEYACFECFWFDAEFDKDGEPHEKEFSSLFANELKDCKDAWVVLGNIYESPELINN